MRTQGRTVEEVLAALAGRSHGVVTRQELLGLGISPTAIHRRVKRGSLLVVHPGVYRVGHCAPSVEATYLAAVRACGQKALLCGAAATHLLKLVKGRAPPPEVLASTERRIPGIRTHRSRHISRADAFLYRGVPVTSVARTIVDVAATLSLTDLARVVHEARVIHHTRPEQVERVLERRPGSAGATNLRRVLRGDVHITLSELERRFLALLRADGLPLPETNRISAGWRVDCRWPAHRLTVELDSYRFHASRHA